MSEKPKPQDIVDDSTYPGTFDPGTEEALENGTATMAELSLQGIRDAWELNRLANPTHGDPKPVDIDPAQVAEITRLLDAPVDGDPIWKAK